jgi:MarR family transcriptional regulator, lower aerobic nicotinate degradation pathway regulator
LPAVGRVERHGEKIESAKAERGPLGKSRPSGVVALQEMPGHLIRRLQQISNALFAHECGRFDLTSVQFAALFVLRAAGELDATRLAEQIAFDRSTIGDVVERLESKGWILRNGSRDDRRVKLIRLTPEGLKLLGRVEPAVKRVQKRLLEQFSPSERIVFLTLLKRLEGLQDDVPSEQLE